ncbi:hypothetical protein GCM10023231_12770 [Olivibacter ginsenosidimutans]|uniref:Uncharacterized protein n=1 Tax=Olivibacter ginsenosidimutans TaxID=1176537 RepID=A0ABP9AU55_9SPHI
MENEKVKVADYNAELVELFEVEELEERMEFATWGLSAKASNKDTEVQLFLALPV